MFKRYIKILSNPLLYYADKEGNSVFRNFALFSQTGCKYSKEIKKADVGKMLEYRFHLNKCAKWGYFGVTLFLYLIFIHVKFSLWSLLFFEAIWIAMLSGVRLWCAYLYRNHLLSFFGGFEVVEFEPAVSKRKTEEFLALFRSKIILIFLGILLFLSPTLILKFAMKHSLTPKHNGYKHVITLSNIYNFVYPKSAKVYDMRAAAHFMLRDYDSSLADYEKALDLSGKRFTKRDYVRFENLLLVKKRVASSQDAVDAFNEYVTKKNMTPLQESEMLWVKSIFKIENSIIDSILQDYDSLLASLDEKEVKNKFYISCDRAYMLFLMQQYREAIDSYDILIRYGTENQELFSKEIPSLYAERGWAKKHLGDNEGAEIDFKTSGIPSEKLKDYEPGYTNQAFVKENF